MLNHVAFVIEISLISDITGTSHNFFEHCPRFKFRFDLGPKRMKIFCSRQNVKYDDKEDDHATE